MARPQGGLVETSSIGKGSRARPISLGLCTRDTADFRDLAYYASPQRGIELFATVERVVTVDACGNSMVVRERRLPLGPIGHGRASLSARI